MVLVILPVKISPLPAEKISVIYILYIVLEQ
jgi:hypothetical protein